MRRLRILHLITLLELGGAQGNTLYSCRTQAAAGHQVWLAAGHGGMLDGEAAALPGVTFVPLPELVHPIRPFSDIRALRRLTRLCRELRPDIVHTHSSKAGIVGRLAASRAGVPVIIHTVHGWSFNPEQSSWRRLLFTGLERRAARTCRFLITVSEHDRRTGLAAGIGREKQYRVIRSGIDWAGVTAAAAERHRVRKELGLQSKSALVLMVACLKPQKAPLDFLRLASAVPDAVFLLAGDGPLRKAVEAEARRLQLGDRFRLLGWRRDCSSLLAAADACVLTSRWEGLPRVIVEALAAGTPVVVTDTGGVREVVDAGKNGFVVPRADAGALCARLQEVLGWAGSDASRGARQRHASANLRDDFDIANMGGRLLRLYEETAG